MRATVTIVAVAVLALAGGSGVVRAEESRTSSLDPSPNAVFGALDVSAFTESFEIAQLYAAEALERAEQDLDARRDELGLIGSAPMVGLGPDRTETVPQDRERRTDRKRAKSRSTKSAH
jgi:hypothetical protein